MNPTVATVATAVLLLLLAGERISTRRAARRIQPDRQHKTETRGARGSAE